MSQSEQYQLVFCGHALEGFEIAEVKAAFARFFRVELSSVDDYFTGTSRVVSQDLDYDTASHYAKVLEDNGIRILVEQMSMDIEDEKSSEDLSDDIDPAISGVVKTSDRNLLTYLKAHHQKIAWTILGAALVVRLGLWGVYLASDVIYSEHYKGEALSLCGDDMSCTQLVENQFAACFEGADISQLIRAEKSQEPIARVKFEKSYFECFSRSNDQALITYQSK